MNRFALYELSVQAPRADIEFFERLWSEIHGHGTPGRLREDFAGTALLASEWARSRAGRTAWAVDVDPEPLAWGRRAHLGDPALARRVELIEGDALTTPTPPVDIVCALNFSSCMLRERSQLADYLRASRERLRPGGLMVLDLYGGTEAIVAASETRELDGFTYVWEQTSYNPITHIGHCAIHFELDDGRRLDDAFTYEWRLWTIGEVRDLLHETGFRDALVYWEAVDAEGDGTGEYRLTECEENQESWLVYVVGLT